MEVSSTQIIAALTMVGVGLILVLAYRSYLARSSERRMLRMLYSLGLDPDLARSGDMETVMGEVRKRCRNCSSEGVCERWLKGENGGDNAFCPNAKVFDILSKYSSAAQ